MAAIFKSRRFGVLRRFSSCYLSENYFLHQLWQEKVAHSN